MSAVRDGLRGALALVGIGCILVAAASVVLRWPSLWIIAFGAFGVAALVVVFVDTGDTSDQREPSDTDFLD